MASQIYIYIYTPEYIFHQTVKVILASEQHTYLVIGMNPYGKPQATLTILKGKNRLSSTQSNNI